MLEHEKVAQAFEIVKKKVNEVAERIKPIQDQVKKSKSEFDKVQTSFKSKVNSSSARFIESFQWISSSKKRQI